MGLIKLTITVGCGAGLALAIAFGATPATGAGGVAKTTRVSVGPDGDEGNGSSRIVAISADGRFVAFESEATNLVQDDMNERGDIFVRDLDSGETERVSVSSGGDEANAGSSYPAISASGRFVAFSSGATNLVDGDTAGPGVFVHDRTTGGTERLGPGAFPALSAHGRFVAFMSRATNLVPGDTNRKPDIFVRDRATGTTERVSVSSRGEQGKGRSGFAPAISANGRFVAFASKATNLVRGDRNRRRRGHHIFVHDRKLGKTTRVSVNSRGRQANSRWNFSPSISANGRFVAFGSYASNLVRGDTNRRRDIFVHDRRRGKTTRVSVSSRGAQADAGSFLPSISANGRFAAFSSGATNLVRGDTNGQPDLFVHDRRTARTRLASVNSAGVPGNRYSRFPAVSGDGRFVAFQSGATNLVENDANERADVFVRGPLR